MTRTGDPGAQHGFKLGCECVDSFFERGVIALFQHAEGGQPGGHGQRVAGQGSGLVHVPGRGDPLHVFGFAAVGSHGQAAADDLAEHGQIGRDAKAGLRPAVFRAEAGDHLVDDEQRAGAVAQGAQALEKAFFRQDQTHVGRDGFHNDGREILAVQVKEIPDRAEVVVRREQGVAHGGFGTPGVPGMDRVATPEPALARKESAWPW